MLSAVLFALFLGALYGAKVLLTRQRPHPLPPGPKPIPVLGNIYDLPPSGTQDWMHWFQHKEVYGPVSSVTVMGQTIVILNDAKSAGELLVKRSSIYSSRPSQVFVSEMVGWGNFLGMLKYSPRLRSYRKAMQPCIGSESAVAQFNPLQEIETHRFLFRVLEDQTKLVEHIQTEAGAIILKIAYGYTVESQKRDPLVEISNLALHHFSKAGTPGAWLVDMIPALKHVPSWLPGAGFKRTAKAWRDNLTAVAEKPYAFVNRQMDEGRHQPSYLSNMFKTTGRPPRGSEDEFVARWTAASLYTGGADTTVCAIENFFLAMTLYPEIQRKAQDEIDRVLGPCQLPRTGDRSRLPYVNALVKEVLRWHPVAPMGIPHASSEDDTWGGYYIPKGSLILPNIWAMTHDPTVYHDPMVFNPERFLGIDGREPEFDPHDLVFGFGRRICPARILADKTLYLNAAQSLAVFNISKAVKDGKEVDVRPTFQPGVSSHPVPWKFHIEPRSAAHESLIRSVEEKHPWEASNAPDLAGI
ncbi:Cytochrome P450 E-class group I [Penicillium fimorum]|uniref:Cytochrome P450 E-class group I n=1 Tax=Penicillium fimorum TaxID=1882269 RepID=A0A9X0CBJ4_9EURO|nr:Cytochrome P450 E-class group I [Penicillium fimorum]